MSAHLSLDPKLTAFLLNAEKVLLKDIGKVCFERCIVDSQLEYLTPLEQNCVDRCTSKYDQVVRVVSRVHANN